MLRFALTATLAIAIVACGGSSSSSSSQDDHHDVRYVGSWALTTGVTSSMERWDLRADGTATLTATNAVLPIDLVMKNGIRCAFGDRWSSIGDVALERSLKCSDGIDRVARIPFAVSETTIINNSDMQIESVNSETDWAACSKPMTLSMVRCATAGGGC